MGIEQPSLDTILNEVRNEFIENTSERLITVDNLISDMLEGVGTDESMVDLQRHIHSIKGQGATFDFPFVSDVAHRLEDYIETSAELDKTTLLNVQKFVDIIRGIVESGNDPSADEAKEILSALPVTAAAAPETGQTPIDEVRIMLVMPKGAQRKIMGKELAACGFHIMNSDTPIDALRLAINQNPNIIIVSRVMEEMSGIEFSRITNILQATRDCHIVIATANNMAQSDLDSIAEGTAIVKKGASFIDELTDYLDLWGYFG